jgi:hypothetical protein
MTETTTNQPKKGDVIYLVTKTINTLGHQANFVSRCEDKVTFEELKIRKVTVESWGRKHGTATFIFDGKFIESRIFTKTDKWSFNYEEASKMAYKIFVSNAIKFGAEPILPVKVTVEG